MELESRFALAIASVTAAAIPNILKPPNGRFVPVTVTGKINQAVSTTVTGLNNLPPTEEQLAKVDDENANQPMLTQMNVLVIDQYRRVEPLVYAPVEMSGTRVFFLPSNKAGTKGSEVLLRTYTYETTVYLQASQSRGNRQYVINVNATDRDGTGTKIIAAVVPSGPLPKASPARLKLYAKANKN